MAVIRTGEAGPRALSRAGLVSDRERARATILHRKGTECRVPGIVQRLRHVHWMSVKVSFSSVRASTRTNIPARSHALERTRAHTHASTH